MAYPLFECILSFINLMLWVELINMSCKRLSCRGKRKQIWLKTRQTWSPAAFNFTTSSPSKHHPIAFHCVWLCLLSVFGTNQKSSSRFGCGLRFLLGMMCFGVYGLTRAKERSICNRSALVYWWMLQTNCRQMWFPLETFSTWHCLLIGWCIYD